MPRFAPPPRKPDGKLRLPPVHDPDARMDPALVAELAAWDAKLRASGVEDIEYRLGDGSLSHHLPRSASEMGRSYREDQAEYYRLFAAWVEAPSEETPTSRWGRRGLDLVANRRAQVLERRRHAVAMRRLRAAHRHLAGRERREAERDRRICRRHAEGWDSKDVAAHMRISPKRVAAALARERAAMLAACAAARPGDHVVPRGAATPVRDSGVDR